MPLGDSAIASRTSRTESNIVEVYINYLRKKLGRNAVASQNPSADCHSVIRTVRGEGYLLGALEDSDLKAGASHSATVLTSIFSPGRRAPHA
jgi:hypothetical protein